MAMMQNRGAVTSIATSHLASGRSILPTRGAVRRSMRTENSTKETRVASMVGMNMAAAFPAKSSLSDTGVASTGSSVFPVFSPMKLYDAIIVGIMAGMSMNMKSMESTIMEM